MKKRAVFNPLGKTTNAKGEEIKDDAPPPE